MLDAIKYAEGRAAEYAAADDWTMARAMLATVASLRRMLALADMRPVIFLR